MKTEPLRFTPYAWAQYITLRDAGDTEVGAYGITDENDPLLVIALVLPKQTVSAATVEVDGEALLDLAEAMSKAGLHTNRWSRIWCHTHPGDCASPSSVDERYFEDLDQEWSAMVILADGGDSYCRFNWKPKNGAPGSCESVLEVDYTYKFGGSRNDVWLKEYEERVTKQVYVVRNNKASWPPNEPTTWRNSKLLNHQPLIVEADDNFDSLEEYECQECNAQYVVDWDDVEEIDDYEDVVQCPTCLSDKTHPVDLSRRASL